MPLSCSTIHGVRAIETIARQGFEGVDLQSEVAWVTKGEMADTDGVVPIDGIADFLNSLPADRWAIMTSATLDLARKRLAAAGITPPGTFVTADDIERGKPNPDCFLLAAKRLGVDAGECLVFEDAPAGIRAAELAGADVAVITATHQHPVDTTHMAIGHYEAVGVETDETGRLKVISRETVA